MATPVEVPKLGNTVEECLVSKWRKRKGDLVSSGDVVADIETDKATFEVSSPVDGIILETFFEEGALVPVFTNLFVVGKAGESAEGFRPRDRSLMVAAQKADADTAPKADKEAPPANTSLPNATLSPRARRFAEEHRFHPPPIAGSGPGGRVLEEDVRRAYHSPPDLSRVAPAAATTVTRAIVAPQTAAPASTMRQRIARRMRESLASTAQYTLHGSADASGLLRLRARIKAAANGPDININDLVVFCTIDALKQVPDLNAEYIDGAIVRHTGIHVGFACDTPRGLLVPVIRNAHQLSVSELAARTKALAASAVQGSISPDDLAGATFTVSNLGNLGIETFTPLLNPPQVAILGIGAITLKPMRRDSTVEFIDSISLSLTCDHQVVDGAPGARFLQVVRQMIESVESLCSI
jgi:pyruvate dehydrogenase E2 component (dihydrolipoamide acetyltransferase)